MKPDPDTKSTRPKRRAQKRRTQAERSAGTRRVVLDSAISTLQEHGYAATTSILVAQVAGISRGAMMHQFPTQADLMTFVVEQVYEDELRRYGELLKDLEDPRERVLAYPTIVWEVLGRPSGIAVLEILQGSRSDAALAHQLRPIQARIESDAVQRLKPLGRSEVILPLMRLIVWAARGLSIAKVLAPDPNRMRDSMMILRDLIQAGIETGRLSPGKPAKRTR
jgi:AcrR family transcriptional regulator